MLTVSSGKLQVESGRFLFCHALKRKELQMSSGNSFCCAWLLNPLKTKVNPEDICESKLDYENLVCYLFRF